MFKAINTKILLAILAALTAIGGLLSITITFASKKQRMRRRQGSFFSSSRRLQTTRSETTKRCGAK